MFWMTYQKIAYDTAMWAEMWARIEPRRARSRYWRISSRTIRSEAILAERRDPQWHRFSCSLT